VPSTAAEGASVAGAVGAGGAGVGDTAGVVVSGAAVVGVGAAVVVEVVDGVGTLSPTNFTSAHAENTSLQHCRFPIVASQLSAELLLELQVAPRILRPHDMMVVVAIRGRMRVATVCRLPGELNGAPPTGAIHIRRNVKPH